MLELLERVTELPWAAWGVLGIGAYILVTCVLSILSAGVRDELERHELAVRTVEQRLSYRRSVQDARDRAQTAVQQRRDKRQKRAA